jgi:hypothetical protein
LSERIPQIAGSRSVSFGGGRLIFNAASTVNVVVDPRVGSGRETSFLIDDQIDPAMSLLTDNQIDLSEERP